MPDTKFSDLTAATAFAGADILAFVQGGSGAGNERKITGTNFWTNVTLVTPALGTPVSGTLTNCTGLPTAGMLDDAVTNAKLADMAQTTVKGRASGAGTGDPTDLTAAQLLTIILTVDGAGSGLDADLLDGMSSAAFAAAAHTHDHGAELTGLADDDHTQYLLLAGRLPSQTVNGSIVFASGNVVTFDGTSIFHNTGLNIQDQDFNNELNIRWAEISAADRVFFILVNGADRTIDLSGNLTVSAAATVSGTNTGDQTITLTGDVTGSGTGSFAATIANDAVTYAKIQNVATDRLLGRDTALSGDTEEITVGGGIEFTGAGGIQTSAFTGDATKTAGGTALTIANDAVTYAKMQNVSATDKVLGRTTAGAGDVEEISTTGSGNVVRATSPTLVTPLLGTPTSGDLQNCTASSDTAKGVIELAIQSEMETATDVARAVTPGRTQYHPGVGKGWIKFNGTGTISISASYNVSSIDDDGVGLYGVNWATDFSTGNYCVASIPLLVTGVRHTHIEVNDATMAVGSVDLQSTSIQSLITFDAADEAEVYLMAMGDQ